MSEVKLVIVVRTKYPGKHDSTTGIRKGKTIAQACHAASNWLLQEAIRSWQTQTPFIFTEVQLAWWLNGNVAKIALQAKDEAELDEVHRLAKEAGLPVHVVIDSGLTEFNGVPTKTVLSIGPDFASKIDEITGVNGKIPLKLY